MFGSALKKIVFTAMFACLSCLSVFSIPAYAHQAYGTKVHLTVANVTTVCPTQTLIATLQPGQEFTGTIAAYAGGTVTLTDSASGSVITAGTVPQPFDFNPSVADTITACVTPAGTIGYVTYKINQCTGCCFNGCGCSGSGCGGGCSGNGCSSSISPFRSRYKL